MKCLRICSRDANTILAYAFGYQGRIWMRPSLNRERQCVTKTKGPALCMDTCSGAGFMHCQRYGAPAEVYLDFGKAESEQGDTPESPRARDIEPRPYLRARAKNVLNWWMSVYMGRLKKIGEQAICLKETFSPTATYSSRINTKLARLRVHMNPSSFT